MHTRLTKKQTDEVDAAISTAPDASSISRLAKDWTGAMCSYGENKMRTGRHYRGCDGIYQDALSALMAIKAERLAFEGMAINRKTFFIAVATLFVAMAGIVATFVTSRCRR